MRSLLVVVLLVALPFLYAQQATSLVATGSVLVGGSPRAYSVRHLPVGSFPDLPAPVADALTKRGCTVPQTYEAHGPENVIHGSLEHAGSSDWAVLCSAQGTVSLLVFFADAPAAPVVLASVPETGRLQDHSGAGELGFNWAIDPAGPQKIHDAQRGMSPRPAMLEHDALADSTLERGVTYRYYTNGAWSEVPLPD